MATIRDAVATLTKTLETHFTTFSTSEKLHFEWLQSIRFQLRMYGHRDDQVDREPIDRPRSLPNTASLAQFDGQDRVSRRPYSFTEQFPFVLEEIPIPQEYEMSDDEIGWSARVDDHEIYENNPFEIHGKFVPLWARQENLRKQFQRQKSIDGDALFGSVPKLFETEKVFGPPAPIPQEMGARKE
jgi:hypothetical protein